MVSIVLLINIIDNGYLVLHLYIYISNGLKPLLKVIISNRRNIFLTTYKNRCQYYNTQRLFDVAFISIYKQRFKTVAKDIIGNNF